MTTHRLIPPAGKSKIIVNGRTYDPAAGAQDVPDFDCAVLEANGWSLQAVSVTTAGRPVNPSVGTKVYDSTVGHTIVWDGKAWRDEGGSSR
jgi:hypothetical protein